MFLTLDKTKNLLVIFIKWECSKYLCKISNGTIFTSSIHHPVVIFQFHSVNHFLNSMEPHKADLIADAAYPADTNADAYADAGADADADSTTAAAPMPLILLWP
jgi:hypothetical protein